MTTAIEDAQNEGAAQQSRVRPAAGTASIPALQATKEIQHDASRQAPEYAPECAAPKQAAQPWHADAKPLLPASLPTLMGDPPAASSLVVGSADDDAGIPADLEFLTGSADEARRHHCFSPPTAGLAGVCRWAPSSCELCLHVRAPFRMLHYFAIAAQQHAD